jgi:hypothetical protein
MNTSAEATKHLGQALSSTREAAKIIENLIVAHDYQDVALLVTQAAAELLETAAALMQSQDESAVAHLEDADNLLDAVWDIIDAETDDE